VTREAFRHLREPGDIDEDERPVELVNTLIGVPCDPVELEARQIRT
jgi:hypothetical protein